MKIIKTKNYEKDFKKKIKSKHKKLEMEIISSIENLILDSSDFKSLLLNPLSRIYNIKQKEGNLKEIFTADINNKMRLYIKPVGEYPYKQMEIIELEFIQIDDKHYGDG